MKIENAPKLAVAIAALAAMAFFPVTFPAAYGQSRPFAVMTPSSPILPMSNPVAPSGSPVQPAVASPFIRYGGTTPQVVLPSQSRSQTTRPQTNRPQPSRPGNDGRGVVYVPVPVPYYYGDNYYYQAPVPTVTIPGQLPNVPYEYNRQTSFSPNPNAPPSPVPGATFVYEPQAAAAPSQPRMIVNEPQPGRVIVPPAVGTSRAEVLMRFGEPFGIIRSGGNESLYFHGGLTVVIAPDGRVAQTR